MRTKVSLQGCTSCDTQATPKQLQVFRRVHGTPSRYLLSLSIYIPLFVRNLAVQIVQGKAPGAGPGQWGFSKVLRSGDGAGFLGQGQPHTCDPDQLSSNSPIGIAPFGSVSYTINTTLERA